MIDTKFSHFINVAWALVAVFILLGVLFNPQVAAALGIIHAVIWTLVQSIKTGAGSLVALSKKNVDKS